MTQPNLDNYNNAEPPSAIEVYTCQACGGVIHDYELEQCQSCDISIHSSCKEECANPICNAKGCKSCLIQDPESLEYFCDTEGNKNIQDSECYIIWNKSFEKD
jgi:hypothetical protein